VHLHRCDTERGRVYLGAESRTESMNYGFAGSLVDGALEESALLIAAPERRTRYGAGGTFTFGPSHIHRLTCAAPRATSLHTYSPPLWRLGQYTVDPEGALHRMSVSYADELRPLDQLAA